MTATPTVDIATLFSTQEVTRLQTIAVLADRYLYYCAHIEKMSPHTLPTKRTHLKQFVEFCRQHGKQYAEDLTLQWVDFYFYEFSQKHAHSTTNTAKRVLKAFFRWLEERAGVESVSPEAIKSRKNTKPRPPKC